MKPEKLFSREFVLMTVIGFFCCNNFYILLAVIPRYGLEVFRFSETQAGIVSALFLVGMMVSRLIAGYFVNTVGFRKMLVLGIFGLVVFTLGYFVADSMASLLTVRFFNGFAYGLTANTCITVVSTITPRSRSGEGVGYYSMFQMVAWAIGPYMGVELARSGAYDLIFILAIVLPAAGFVFFPFMKFPPSGSGAPTENMEADPVEPRGLQNFIESRAVPFGLTLAFSGVFLANITGFLSVFTETIGLGEYAGYYFIVYVAFLVATRPFASRLFDRRGGDALIYPGIIIVIIGFILVSQIRFAAMLLIAAAVLGVGLGAVQNATLALTVKAVPTERLGVANATYFLILDTSAAVGPVAGGALIEWIGYRSMYMCGAFCALTALLLYRKNSKNAAT